jgi:hypothetical protein
MELPYMQYVPPLRILAGDGEVEQSETQIKLPLEAFYALLRAAFSGAAFDAAWYTATYSDVAPAISEGIVPDAITHFVRHGYREGRLPRSFDVNPRWYEDFYEDVATAIRSGMVSDARSHYNTNGYYEPRAPDPESAAAFATVLAAAVTRSESRPQSPRIVPESRKRARATSAVQFGAGLTTPAGS